ncbi:hypothetical protein QVD17_25247 [Tagetes erecta]|uniref:Uncharacterized protein n=1 Tax=Tagetes erecta TaxID=13708 RepID=A0AAD8KJH4_TARER|nr:hypothetical protein QVD17_25247 [Tagetes erecta]
MLVLSRLCLFLFIKQSGTLLIKKVFDFYLVVCFFNCYYLIDWNTSNESRSLKRLRRKNEKFYRIIMFNL